MKIKNLKFPVNDELLKSHNFFELYPFDGGGCFVNREMLGTAEDNEIYEKIINENALKDFGCIPKLDFSKFERWISIEKSCWLNRFYFIVPLAKKYWLTKDERIAAAVKNIILHFIRNYPAPATKEEIGSHLQRVFKNRDENYNSKPYAEYSKDETDVEYIWFDFQPASRILHFLYAFHFLEGASSISESEWQELEASISTHARVIMLGEKYFTKLAKGNHQSLRGMSLLLAAAFLNGTIEGREYAEEGLRICNYHIENDFLEDGVLHEVSPSYHIFETWHLRDAYIISENYGFALTHQAGERLRKAMEFAASLCQPDKKSTVINDGYALSLEAFIKASPVKTTQEKAEVNARYFHDTGLGFYSDKGRYLLFDASIFTGSFSHYHGGKNAFTYWVKRKAFFIDNGCCSYDKETFASFKKSEMHSSLLIDGFGDSILNGTYNWKTWVSCICSGWEKTAADKYSLESVLSSSTPAWKGIKWKRKMSLPSAEKLVITDEVESSDNHEFCFIYNLHPDVDITKSGTDKFILQNGDISLSFSIECNEPYTTETRKAVSFIDFRERENQQILIYTKAQSIKSVITLDQ